MTYAGFWKRFAAALIDGIILGIGNTLISVAFGVGVVSSSDADNKAMGLVGGGIGLVLGWTYFAWMESSPSQATLGKMALSIKVTDLNGNRIGFGRATGRHFGKIISAIVLLIGYIIAAFTEKKQALHDMMAGCLVVNK